MKPEQDDGMLEEAIRRAVGSEEVRFDAAGWMKKHPEEVSILESRKSNAGAARAPEQTLQPERPAGKKSNMFSLLERIRNMNKMIKYPIAAAIVLALLIGAGSLLMGPRDGSVFADVRQQIEQAKTMTMNVAVEMKMGDKPFKLNMKMYFKTPGLMRQEMTTDAQPPAPADSQPASSPKAVKTISIFDIPNLKGIILVPNMKKAMVFEFKNVPEDMKAQALKEKDYLGELKRALAGEHEDLGEKTIDGRKARGYRCKSTTELVPVTMEIWADATTGKPIMVEQTLPEGMGKATMTDFVINPVLDDSLFDTKVPEGYTVEKQPVVDFNVTEKELTDGLKMLAGYCDNAFPKVLLPTPELIQKLMKLKISDEEGKAFGLHMQKMMIFQVGLQSKEGEFVYAGEGVKLGDKETPILWYKAKDAGKYRVIYGDLHGEAADTAPKRPASQPAAEPR